MAKKNEEAAKAVELDPTTGEPVVVPDVVYDHTPGVEIDPNTGEVVEPEESEEPTPTDTPTPEPEVEPEPEPDTDGHDCPDMGELPTAEDSPIPAGIIPVKVTDDVAWIYVKGEHVLLRVEAIDAEEGEPRRLKSFYALTVDEANTFGDKLLAAVDELVDEE